jgi:hypothetical protein
MGCLEMPDLFLVLVNTRDKSGISSHPCIILYVIYGTNKVVKLKN